MVENRYKIIISNNNIYREIELAPDMQQIKVGTAIDCDVRLRKEFFFGEIELLFVKNNGEWFVLCSDNLYLTIGDVRKLMKKTLVHGEMIEVKYQESDHFVFSIDFLIDFDDGKRKYERVIDIAHCNSVAIGRHPKNNIALRSAFINNDTIGLVKKNDELVLVIKEATYGVYHNGRKAKNQEVIKDMDFLSIADFFFYYKQGQLWTEIRDDMQINGLNYSDKPTPESYPKFNRNTRIKNELSEETIEILDPPAKPQKPKNNLLMRLLPSCGMLVASGVMAFMGGAMIIVSAISGVMAIVTTVLSMKEGNKEYNQNVKEREEKYNSYIANKTQEIEECRAKERAELEQIFISQKTEEKRFEDFSPDLFDRVATDEDFLVVRLGSGSLEAKQKINYKKQEKLEVEDELQLIPEQLCSKYKYIQDAPIVCNFKDAYAVGIIGSEENRFELFKNIVIDIAARQYFSEVGMVFVAESKHKNRIHWLRMLPHAYSDQVDARMIVTDDESKNLVFEYLYKELSIREQNKGYDRNLVVFLYDEYGFKNHPLSKFVEKAQELGVTFVFFGEKKSDISIGCSYLVDIKNEHTAVLISTDEQSGSTEFKYPKLEAKKAEEIVRILAPIYTEEISLEGTLTKNISMFEMLNILAVDDLDLNRRWGASQVFKSMAAPLGVSKTGIVNLDLHDKAHGPHGLVAGTTGSGKSEILQTYILAMATLYHPYEVGFVIIDFKGGGMVNQFKDLPHLLGAITNIDGKEINRSLKSIKAELQKRQRLFAEADVNHIDKYIKKFKKGEVETALPHLIIIVDEFAELKAEQPEFMKELISAARIGRSLGVHLILATQKPSGQVNEQIWSNSRFKLCLKVQSPEDSNEVLKSPLAAEIKEAGRAYLQVGNNEIFELFQSAYSGAPEKADTSNVKEFTVLAYTDSGKKIPVYVQKKKGSVAENRTQLDAIVEYVSVHCEKNNLQKLSDICLPPLRESIDFPEGTRNDDNTVSIGTYDDPDTQYQGNANINFTENNALIVGASQTGKTNLLQLIIRSIAENKQPNEANFYIIDFGSMILKNFEALNHVGGVVLASEEEKLKNLFKLIFEEINYRKEKLLSVGVSSYSSYLEAGYKDLAQIYLMLDNFAVFKELYADKYEDDFQYIAREGISYGISMIVTCTTSNSFGYRYMVNFPTHIALTCNDASEYSNLFDRCRMEPANIPGRALFTHDKNIYEVQTYLSFKGEKEIERVLAIREFVNKMNSTSNGQRAKRIPEVPDELNLAYIYDNYNVNVSKQMAVALDYKSVEPVCFDLMSMTQLLMLGKFKESIKTCVKTMIEDMKHHYFSRPVELYIVDSLSRDLKEYADEAFVEDYTLDYSRLSLVFEGIKEKLKERYEGILESGLEYLDSENLIMVIINNVDAINYISSSRDLMATYNEFITKYKSLKIMFIFTGVEDENIGYSSPDLLKKLKDNRKALVFSNLTEHKVFDVPASIIRQNKKPIDSTQAYYINESEVSKVKFAKEG